MTLSTESPTPEELRSMQETLARAQAQPTQSGNPLAGYMRTPQIYLSLPSKGKYWKEGSVDWPSNGELPVLAMSTRDELVLKSPDALMNGQAVVDVIEHCIPAIKDAWEIPVCDFDHILIGIELPVTANRWNTQALVHSAMNLTSMKLIYVCSLICLWILVAISMKLFTKILD